MDTTLTTPVPETPELMSESNTTPEEANLVSVQSKQPQVNPFNKSILLSINCAKFGISKTNDAKDIEVKADKRLITSTRKIIDCDEYRKICNIEVSLKNYLKSKCVPGAKFLKRGVYSILFVDVAEVDKKVTEAIEEFEKAVTEFVAVYPQRRQECQDRLEGLAKDSDYPSQERVKAEFSLGREYISIGTPTDLKEVSQEIFNRESQAKMVQLQEASQQVTDSLITMFNALVDHATEQLTKADGGQSKVIKAPMLAKFDEFFARFGTLVSSGVVNQSELESLMSLAKDALNGVDADTLRKNPESRTNLKNNLNDIKAAMSEMLTDKPGRVVILED